MTSTSSSPPAATVAGHTMSTKEARSRAAIALAAQRTGVDFDYLMAQAKLESSFDPDARARTSSASGLYQFIDSTWLATLDRHGASLGLGGAADAVAIRGGRHVVTDPALRGQIMALRFDPQASALMAGALATDNAAALAPVLGRQPDAAELYMAHFLGAGGASRFLTELARDPQRSAASLLPAPAAANRTIFYTPNGTQRTLQEVMDLMRSKVAGAMGQSWTAASPGRGHPASGGMPGRTAFAGWSSAPLPQANRQGPDAPQPPRSSMAETPSMAETLRENFALHGRGGPETERLGRAGGPGAPGSAHVRHAYVRLQAFGL